MSTNWQNDGVARRKPSRTIWARGNWSYVIRKSWAKRSSTWMTSLPTKSYIPSVIMRVNKTRALLVKTPNQAFKPPLSKEDLDGKIRDRQGNSDLTSVTRSVIPGKREARNYTSPLNRPHWIHRISYIIGVTVTYTAKTTVSQGASSQYGVISRPRLQQRWVYKNTSQRTYKHHQANSNPVLSSFTVVHIVMFDNETTTWLLTNLTL